MFAKSIVLSDAFLDMPMSARCLYFTLGMLADDDGFVGSPKSIMRQCGASNDDMAVLIQKRYVLGFETGIIVIKHWRMNNYLRNDRYVQTTYLEEKEQLAIDEKGAYTEKNKLGIPNGYQMDTQDSIDKNRIDKNSIDKDIRHKHGLYKNVLLTDEQLETLKKEIPNYQDYIEKVSEYVASTGKSYKNYLATIRNWYRKDNQNKPIDVVPVYDTSNNKKLSNDELNNLLALRGTQ